MKVETLGSLVPFAMYGELVINTQGTDKLILPAMWQRGVYVAFSEVVIFCQFHPSSAHSFTFFKNGSAITGSDVTMGTTQRYARKLVNFAMQGQIDYLSVRHDTSAQDANEALTTSAHADEGIRAWAAAIPERVGM